jgi:hypothetical protein
MLFLSEMRHFLGVSLNKGVLVSIRNEIESQYRVLLRLNIRGLIETEKWVNGRGGGGFALFWCGWN